MKPCGVCGESIIDFNISLRYQTKILITVCSIDCFTGLVKAADKLLGINFKKPELEWGKIAEMIERFKENLVDLY
ncbi:hypothetical protein LCGC14_0196160 [marine sediment metagenome]|uniref:Uncharacterized protein n=1 Tax=marine sediment metagenome TaxID=412755 RepID=A0A0F9XNL5_9ZZZZ